MLGEDRANAIFDQIDADKSGELDFAEFRKVMKVIAGEGAQSDMPLASFTASSAAVSRFSRQSH